MINFKNYKINENRFIFIICFRNVENYITDCIDSILLQKYKKWEAVFCDDNSCDRTFEIIPKNKNFKVFRSKKRIGLLENTYKAMSLLDLNDEDVICLLDGDDYLIGNGVLEILNKIYSEKDVLLTYGQYVSFKRKHEKVEILNMGHCRSMNDESFKEIRSKWFASHLKTFKYKLFKEMMKQDPYLNSLKDKSGNFYTTATDVALFVPLMEIAGQKSIRFNEIPLYFYRKHNNNVDKKTPKKQLDNKFEIFSKKPFKKVYFGNNIFIKLINLFSIK